MLTLSQALFVTLITEFVARVSGQTTCKPLVQALLQQAEATNGYGSWDACCARTGIDCFLSRLVVPLGFEPCDVTHGARAGCNRLAQGTVCMIEEDDLISGSPCGASVIRTCGSVIARGDGVATPFDPPSDVEATFANILTRGMLGSQLCCSTSSCTFSSQCTSQYNMSACVTDEVNSICIPLDQSDNKTYAAQIVEDGHNCTATTSTAPTKKGGGNTAIIGGSVGGAVGLVCIAVLSIFLCVRNRRRNRNLRAQNVPTNESPQAGHQGTAATSHLPSFPGVPGARSTPVHTPSFPSHPGPQMISAAGTLPSFPRASHLNQNTFEFPANHQNPSQVHQDPHTNIISPSSRRSQNISEFPANPFQVYQNPGASTIIRPGFQRPASPPPPSFYSTDVSSSVMDTPAMEARIAALENRIVALSGPSSEVQAEGSRRGRGEKEDSEADPPRYDDLE